MIIHSTKRPIIKAGLFLGIGMGGLFDGILFHQILQVHHMLSSVIPVQNLISAKINMMWDGYFHVGVWLVTLIGIQLLFMAGKDKNTIWSQKVFIGSLMTGWGLFNLVEGMINHQILGKHHVLEYVFDPLPYDLAFLASGIILIVIGWRLMLHDPHQFKSLF